MCADWWVMRGDTMHVCEDEEGASGVAIEERGGGVLQTEVSAIHEDGWRVGRAWFLLSISGGEEIRIKYRLQNSYTAKRVWLQMKKHIDGENPGGEAREVGGVSVSVQGQGTKWRVW